MGYSTSNAAFAYDMQSAYPAYDGSAARQLEPAPSAVSRPELGVVTGAGREASQGVSPVFVHAVKVFCILVALFCAVGAVRVVVSSACAGILNANAQLANELEAAQTESSDLEVMHSVYGSSTRIRDIAEGTYGMVDATDGVTIDLGDAPASSTAE